ncbi:hypothetical protein GCM10027569_66930 [Flindersiella endophytica]
MGLVPYGHSTAPAELYQDDGVTSYRLAAVLTPTVQKDAASNLTVRVGYRWVTGSLPTPSSSATVTAPYWGLPAGR